jgi:hypothetical protein
MTGNERDLISYAKRSTIALESIAVSANRIANGVEDLRLELKRIRFDKTLEKETNNVDR